MQDDQASKKYVALLENENFLSLCSTQFKLSLIQKLSLLFPLAHNLASKTGIFFVLQRVATILSCCFHWRISKPKPIFLLNQKHQLLKFIKIFIFHVAIVKSLHRQKIRSYFKVHHSMFSQHQINISYSQIKFCKCSNRFVIIFITDSVSSSSGW